MPIEVDCIIPVVDEGGLAALIQEIRSTPLKDHSLFITVVDDGSLRPIADGLVQDDRLRILRHPVNLGNGAAIKTGLFSTGREIVVLMDGDGQHNPAYLQGLLDGLGTSDLVIASRANWVNCGFFRASANRLYCAAAGWLLGRQIDDITSGFRAFRRSVFCRVFPIFPNKFSSPITLALFAHLMNRTVSYHPIVVRRREGKSKIRIVSDGVRFLHGIMKIGILANPMKFFYALAAVLATTGLVYTVANSFITHRIFVPGGASILFILMGMSLVTAHIVDFARLILILTICGARNSATVGER